MNKQQQLALAISIAADAHYGQFDKGGKPYILHPLKLMNELLWDLQLATIAVLHDVEEDTGVSLVGRGFSPRVMSALALLKHDSRDSYEDYIEKVCTNLDAITVKRKDLEHNSCITRLKGVTPKDLARVDKYHKAFVRLTEAKRNFQRK